LLGSDEIDGEHQYQPAKTAQGKSSLSERELDELRVLKGMSDMFTAPWDARPIGKLSSRSWRGLTSGQAVEDDSRSQWRDRAGFSPASTAIRELSYGRLLILVNQLLRLSETEWLLDFTLMSNWPLSPEKSVLV
jgi:hypothetical protein